MNERVDPRLSIGGNFPPQTIEERLQASYADILAELEALADRANKGPREIKADSAPDDLETCGALVKDATTLAKQFETARVTEKEPHLTAERQVDAYFKGPKERLARIVDAFTAVANKWAQAQRDQERKRAEEQARKAREEQATRDEAARKAVTEGRSRAAATAAERAREAGERAAQAEAAIAAASAPSKVVTNSGTTISAKTSMDFEIVDYAVLPLDVLRPYIKREALAAAVKLAVKQGIRDMTGVRFFESVKTNFR